MSDSGLPAGATGHTSDVQPPRVVLAGWYGAANLGDELLLEIIAGWVRDAGGVPVAISLNPQFTAETLGIEAVGYTDLPAIVDVMSRSRVFVLGGGGLFQDYDLFNAATLACFPALNVGQFAQFFYLGEELGLTTVALAQGLGPLRGPEGRTIAADVLNRARYVSLRDGASAALAREIGVSRNVTVAADPAWVWRAPSPSGGNLVAQFPALAGKRVVAFILRDWPFLDGWEDAFIEAMRGQIPEGWACLWLEFDRPASDKTSPAKEIARRLITRLDSGPVHVVWEGRTAHEAGTLLAQCDACVAMRLHGVLLAHGLGLPTVSIEYDSKVATLNSDLGVPALQCVPMEAITSRLREGVELILRDKTSAFRLDRAFAQRKACDALRHRDMLLSAMAAPRAGTGQTTDHLGRDPWLPRWLSAGGFDVGLDRDFRPAAEALDDHQHKFLSAPR
jgi:polysaccharide pyruvyl transferase CsaB